MKQFVTWAKILGPLAVAVIICVAFYNYKSDEPQAEQVEVKDIVRLVDGEPAEIANWKLVWADEFEGDDWDHNTYERCPAGRANWCQEQYPADESLAVVNDGVLTLWAKVADSEEEGFGGYKTGGIQSRGKKGFNLGRDGVVGRVDVKARMSDAKGFWPAIWMLPEPHQDWAFGGEIDLMEHLNQDSIVYMTLHWSVDEVGQDISYGKTMPFFNRDDWHVFTTLVYKDAIYIYLDGVMGLKREKDESRLFDWPWDTTDFFILLDSQLNGGWVGQADGSDLPAHLDIEYVRYLNADNAD